MTAWLRNLWERWEAQGAYSSSLAEARKLYTPKEIELARGLPFTVATVHHVVHLLGEQRGADVLAIAAHHGRDPVEIAEFLLDYK